MIQQHFCATIYMFNKTGDKTLLALHKKLGKWFPAGGHVEENEDYREAAEREVKEELGISNDQLLYPEYLEGYDGTCLQPFVLQKYEIIPDNHYHYELVFGAIIDEETKFYPAEGESKEIEWFDIAKIDDISTSPECRRNVKNMAKLIRDNYSREQAQNNLYLWPRYDDSLKRDLDQFVEGRSFASWNLGDLYDKVPCDFANKMNVKYGIFTSTGTAGLHASLMALGLKPGDEVIVPSMTFIRSVTPLIHLGLTPVVADIDSRTGNISPESIEKNITPRTRAVVAVHMWGIPADCTKIREICNKHNISMIEDFSHAHFSKYRDKFVGSFGDVSFASLQRKKNISVGEGGIIVTNSAEIYDRLQDITSPGSFPKSSNYSEIDFSGYGLNMRISPFGAVAAKNLLPKIDDILSDKRKNLSMLIGILHEYEDYFELPSIPQYTTFDDISWYSYKPKLKDSISLKQLQESGLWKFSDFGYPAIASHEFWRKDIDYFPFCHNIKPLIRENLPGHEEYLHNRITLNIPTAGASYWNKRVTQEWRKELGKLLAN